MIILRTFINCLKMDTDWLEVYADGQKYMVEVENFKVNIFAPATDITKRLSNKEINYFLNRYIIAIYANRMNDDGHYETLAVKLRED